MYSPAANNHRIALVVIGLLILVLGVLVFIVPPAIFPDPSWGFQVMRCMQLGGGFNQLTSPAQDNIANNTSEFLTWWSPGQYLLPYLFKLLTGVNQGKAAALTITFCNLLGVAGFYRLFKKLGFSKNIATLSIAFIVCQQFFVIPYIFYNGGETLLFGYLGWFLVGCFSFENVNWKTLLFVLLSGWVGFFCKSAFLWMYASGLCCLWIRVSSMYQKDFKKWIINGMVLGIPAIVSLGCIYKFFLSKGESPVTASQGLHFGFEAFGFPLASPLLAGFSVDDLVQGLLYHPDGPMFSPVITIVVLVLLAIVSILLILAIIRFVPLKNYRTVLLVFYGFSVLFFVVVFLRQLAISYEGRHFRIVGLLVIPGTVYLFSRLKIPFKVLFALIWTGIAFSSFQYLSSGYERDRLTSGHGPSGISQQFIDQPSLNYIHQLDGQHYNAVFVFISADIGLEIQHNRIITLEPVGPDIKINYEDYVHQGHTGQLYILLPSDYATNGKAKIIENCFPGYKNFITKDLSEDYTLYMAE